MLFQGRSAQIAASLLLGALATTAFAFAGEDGGLAKKDKNQTAARVRPPAREVVEVYEQRDKPVDVGHVNYAENVAVIVQGKCQECDRPKQSAPFSLLTFEDVRRHAPTIREVIDDRRMPPWHADPRYGHFDNDRSLSAVERSTLLAWVDQGCPPGDLSKAPSPRKFVEGWTIGKPDLVFEMPREYKVAADGVLPYERFVVPTNFKVDTWIQAAEARPGDLSVVHHIVVYVNDHKKGKDESARRSPPAHLCGYAPGDLPTILPEGSAKMIPAGSDLIFEMHYTPIGREKVDRSKIGLILAKGPVKHRAMTHGIANRYIKIPPGASDHEEKAAFTFPVDSTLIALMPHMHLRGKSFQYVATYPDGKSEILLSVPQYDFNWQTYYRLAESNAMPKGTRIECFAHYDNSTANPFNPDPTLTVRWGQHTFEEMMIGYVLIVQDLFSGEAKESAGE
ncbi:MAG: hypothetical protein NVSMB14_12870 [Isosphaeraceae bacterium]